MLISIITLPRAVPGDVYYTEFLCHVAVDECHDMGAGADGVGTEATVGITGGDALARCPEYGRL